MRKKTFSSWMTALLIGGMMVWLPACGEPVPAPDTAPDDAEAVEPEAGDAESDDAAGVIDEAIDAADDLVEAVLPSTPVADIEAAQWGFAARLPADTQMAIGLENLGQHLDNLLNSVFWQRISLLMEEAIAMAPDEDEVDLMAEFRRYAGQSMVMAIGAGAEEWLSTFIKLDAINTRNTIRAMLSGGGEDMLESADYMASLMLVDMGTMVEMLAPLELPTVTMSFKVTEPDTVIERFWNDETRAMIDDRVDVGEFELGGHEFVSLTTRVERFLTDDIKAQLLADAPVENRDDMESMLEMAAAKDAALAFGMVDDHLVLFIGSEIGSFQLAPADGALTTDPTFAKLAPWQDNLRVTWVFASQALQQAAWTNRPLMPIFEGLVDGLEDNETFGFIGQVLNRYRDRMGEREEALFESDFDAYAGVSWWEGGWHGEEFGGQLPRFMTSDVPLKFLRAASNPTTVIGLAFNGDPDYSQQFRAYLEVLGEAGYAALQEIVRSGLLGPEAGQNLAKFEEGVLPQLLEIYQGQKMLFEEGLGSQYGFLVDLQGRGPANPVKEMIPLDFEDLTFFRFASMYDVADRDAAAAGWNKIGPTINRLVRNNPFMSSPVMLNPLSMNEGDMKIWFYPTPVFNDEFLLSSAINDDVMVIGTSRSLAASIRDTATPVADDPTAFYFKFDLRPVVEATHSWEELAIELELVDEQTIRDGFLQAREWLSPFQKASWRRWKDDSGWRSSWSLDIRDMVAFD